MGYTRYNYKPRKKPGRNFLSIGAIGILLAIVIGLLIGKLIFKPNNVTDSEQTSKTKETEQNNALDNASINASNNVIESENKKRFSMIQCGFYGKKENAEKVLNEIPSTYNKFIIEENGKFRIIAGIYAEDNVDKVIEKLTKKEIASVKIKCDYELSDSENSMICEIVSGFMKILNELENQQVKSVNTTEFKKWVNELENDSKGEIKSDELKDLKKHIEKLPKELDRNGAKKSLEFMYKMLIKHRV